MRFLSKEATLGDRLKLALAGLTGLGIGLASAYWLMAHRIETLTKQNQTLRAIASDQVAHVAKSRAASPTGHAPAPPPPTNIVAAPEATPSATLEAPAPKPSAPPVKPGVQETHTTKRAAERPKPPPAPPTPARETTRPESVAQAAPRIQPAQDWSRPAPPSPPPAAAPRHEPAEPAPEAAAAPTNKATIRATLAQANIAGLDNASVTFRTGLRVQVGSQFPSGERLLSASPTERKIETDRRIILLQAEPIATPAQGSTPQ